MANEDKLLLVMFLEWTNERETKHMRKPGIIFCKPKMFLKEIRNIFRVSDTNFVSTTNVARRGKQENISVHSNVSATLCSRVQPH